MSIKQKGIILVLVLAFVSGGLLFPQKAPFRIKGDGVGYTLLDEVILMFEGAMNLPPGEFAQKINTAVNRLAIEARKAKKENKIDDSFYKRYMRILRVIKLIMSHTKEAPLFTALIEEEVNRFDIEKKVSFDESQGVGLGSVAGAISEELLSMKRYLDKKSK